MGRTLNPSQFVLNMPKKFVEFFTDLHKNVNGQLDQGAPGGKDSTGNYNKFSQGNQSGLLIRISASGQTDNKNAWTTNGTGISINHGLVDAKNQPRQPIGVRLESSNKQLSIWQTQVPDTTNVYVAPSDASAYATIYVF